MNKGGRKHPPEPLRCAVMVTRDGVRRAARIVLVGAAAGLATLALLGRASAALRTPTLLDWDETYYASTTATAAHGLGFYPYVDGYPQIPDMGGVGYVVAAYVAAYRAFGPHLSALRGVSVAASVLTLGGLAVWTRRLHGSAAAVVAVGVAPWLLLFQLTNSIRLDVFVVAFVSWSLVLYGRIGSRTRPPTRAHALVGLCFALGLEVHLHTAAAACAVGVAYACQGQEVQPPCRPVRHGRLRVQRRC
jgi:hypothetical protein